MPTQKPRVMVTLEPEMKRRLDKVAASMRMRPSTYASWLLSGVLENLEAAQVLERGVEKALNALRIDEAAWKVSEKAQSKKRAPAPSLGRPKGSRKGAARGAA